MQQFICALGYNCTGGLSRSTDDLAPDNTLQGPIPLDPTVPWPAHAPLEAGIEPAGPVRLETEPERAVNSSNHDDEAGRLPSPGPDAPTSAPKASRQDYAADANVQPRCAQMASELPNVVSSQVPSFADLELLERRLETDLLAVVQQLARLIHSKQA